MKQFLALAAIALFWGWPQKGRRRVRPPRPPPPPPPPLPPSRRQAVPCRRPPHGSSPQPAPHLDPARGQSGDRAQSRPALAQRRQRPPHHRGKKASGAGVGCGDGARGGWRVEGAARRVRARAPAAPHPCPLPVPRTPPQATSAVFDPATSRLKVNGVRPTVTYTQARGGGGRGRRRALAVLFGCDGAPHGHAVAAFDGVAPPAGGWRARRLRLPRPPFQPPATLSRPHPPSAGLGHRHTPGRGLLPERRRRRGRVRGRGRQRQRGQAAATPGRAQGGAGRGSGWVWRA